MKTEIAKLIVFGRGGDTVYYSAYCRSTGYGNPENPHAATETADRIIPDGTPVIDLRDAVETDAGFSYAISGPMVNPDLKDDDVSYCPEPSEILAEAMQGNEYGALLNIHAAQKAITTAPGALDFISTAEYFRNWRERGAKIGYYKAGKFIWQIEGTL
jgi:hypothetical protein